MKNTSRHYRRTLVSTTAALLCTGMSFGAWAAFDPTTGAEPARYPGLPDTTVLTGPRPLTPAPTARSYASPLQPIQMPARPLYPARAVESAPSFPPVDPAVVAQAQQEMQAPPPPEPTGEIAATPNFIAPAPVIAEAPAPSIGAAMSAPSTAVMAAVPPSTEALSDASKTILSHIPSKIDTIKPKDGKKVAITRVSPEIQGVLGSSVKEDAYEAVGMSIKVRRPGLDANYELNRAYTALMGGDTEHAIQIYKDILSTDASNQDALFGLAATYHRLGEIDKARPFYGMLLKLNPNHREGLNNFLVMVSDESPQEALAELTRLEQRNPEFSPIPAQEALVLEKLGYVTEARDKMLRAIELAPDNLTYKYNLAVMLDRQGSYADASALYRMLIDSSLKGQAIPTSTDALQKRLNYITTAAMQGHTGG